MLILILYALAMTYLSSVFGLMAKTPEGAGAFGFVMLFLPYLSSAFVPLDTLPKALRLFAEHQPITILVEVLRSLFASTSSTYTIQAVIWFSGILIASAFIAGRIFKRKTS